MTARPQRLLRAPIACALALLLWAGASHAQCPTRFTDDFTGPNGSPPDPSLWVTDADPDMGSVQQYLSNGRLRQYAVYERKITTHGSFGTAVYSVPTFSTFDMSVRYMGTSGPGYGYAGFGVWNASQLPPSENLDTFRCGFDCGPPGSYFAMAWAPGSANYKLSNVTLQVGDVFRLVGRPGGSLHFFRNGVLLHTHSPWCPPVDTFVTRIYSRPGGTLGAWRETFWDDFRLDASPAPPPCSSHLVNLSCSPDRSERNPGFSPDGRSLAYQQYDVAGNEWFRVIDVPTGMVWNERANVPETTHWSWHPSESEIAFQERPHGGASVLGLWSDVLHGSSTAYLLPGYSPIWDPNGLIYYVTGSCSGVNVHFMLPGGPSTTLISNAPALGNLCVSPDGTYLGYTQEVGCSGAMAFTPYVMDPVTGGTVSFPLQPGGMQRSMAFDPSEERVYWCSGELPRIYSAPVTGGSVEPIYLDRPSQFAGPFQFPVGDPNHVFSPDGGRMVVFTGPASHAASHQVEILDLTSGTLTPITHDFHDAVAAVWSPAGDCVAFVGRETEQDSYDLYLYRLSSPRAMAGLDQTVVEGEPEVTLDGRGSISTNPCATELSYSWQQLAGPTALLDTPDQAIATFPAPYITGCEATLTFMLTVSDGECSDTSTVNVKVERVPTPPYAIAEAIPLVTTEGATVVLDGSQSWDEDCDPITYLWSAPSPIAIQDVEAAVTQFIAPPVGASGETFTIQLTVSDGQFDVMTTVQVDVEDGDHPPFALAGPDQVADEGTEVTLDGSASYDPDGDAILPTWTQVAGATVELSDSSSLHPSFTAPAVSIGGMDLVFELVVEAQELISNTDSITIHVRNFPDPPECGDAVAAPALLWPPNHKLVEVDITGITDPNDDPVTIEVIGIAQDEPVDGLGDGDTSPDAVIVDGQLLLRAERSGTGDGRIYEVHFVARDDQGGECTGSVTVCVPHSRKKDPAIDSGQQYDSLSE